MGYLPRQCSGRVPRSEIAQLCGQPRRWITSAGLSPVALAPTGGAADDHKSYTVMSPFAQTAADIRRDSLGKGALASERTNVKS